MFLRSHPIVIFLDRSGFFLYQDLLPNVWQFPFSEDQVLHLEVISKDQLANVIWNFVKTNKLIPSSLIVVLLDSVVFQKDLVEGKQGQKAQDVEAEELKIQQFLENVPFEEPMAKVIGKTRLVATNKELLEAITSPFNKLGCTLESVVPSFVYENEINFSQGLSIEVARSIWKNQDLLKAANMLVDQKEVEVKKEQVETQKQEEKPKNTRQLALVTIFTILLVILGIVYFVVSKSEKTSARPNANIDGSQRSSQASTPFVSTPIPAVDIQPTESIATSPSATVSLSGIKAAVVVNKETQAVGNILKKRLEELGFEDVTVSTSDTTNPARSSVLLSSSIDGNARRFIADEVRKILSDASVQENQSLEDLSVSITVGSSL